MFLEFALRHRRDGGSVFGVPRARPGLLVADERTPHALVKEGLRLRQIDLEFASRLVVDPLRSWVVLVGRAAELMDVCINLYDRSSIQPYLISV